MIILRGYDHGAEGQWYVQHATKEIYCSKADQNQSGCFLMKLFFTLNTVITIVLPIIPTMAKAVMKTPKNTLIPKDISFSIRPLFSSFIKEVLELEFSNAIALLHQLTGTLKPRKGKKRIVLR